MTEPSAQAERFHRARAEFEEATAAGCSILELRRRKVAIRVALRERACAQVAARTADMMDDGAAIQGGFRAWDCRHMMRD
ncbi:MAG: hypothetical protein WBL20_03050 [Sphingobium sp.]|mgnify:CR=1 FL=1|uniref:hypothetical protein n=1 Tax=Sphingobium sp. TaxID=1912891 RepID=UPI002E1B0799